MAIDNANRYSNLIDAKLEQTLALKDGAVFNNRYEGDPKAGAVKVPKTGTSTVSDYDKTNGISATAPSVSYVTVSIDKDKAVNEIIDGFDAATVPANLVADRLTEAGKALARQMDIDGAAELVTSGTAMTSTTAITNKTAYNTFVDARTALSKAGVPVEGRYALVTSDTYAIILNDDRFISASNLGDNIKATGAVGRIAGFNIYETNNFGDDTVEAVFGHPDYATRVKEWNVPVNLSTCTDGKHIGASAIQGRTCYAHKVTQPTAILVKKTAATTTAG